VQGRRQAARLGSSPPCATLGGFTTTRKRQRRETAAVARVRVPAGAQVHEKASRVRVGVPRGSGAA
jgi:hypothetical protein